MPFLAFLHVPWALTLAPCFYYYVKYSVKPVVPISEKPKHPLALFIPFIAVSLSIWGVRLYTFLLDKPDIIKNIFYFYLELLNLTAIVVSAVASFQLLNKFRTAKKKMPERFFIKLGWLRKSLSCRVLLSFAGLY